MSPAIRNVLIGLAICVLGALIYWFVFRHEPAPPPPAPVAAPAAPAPAVPQQTPPPAPPPPAAGLPSLADSDNDMLQALMRLFGPGIEKLILRPGIIHRIVATVDNLPGTKVPQQVLPVRNVGGAFLTAEQGGRLTIGRANAARYLPYVNLALRMDTEQLVSVYRRYYPLFEQAYRDLGYPSGIFNDRLIEAIDDLLEAPQPEPPVPLVAPRAMYEFADADLQDASAGQKVLIRLGPENETRVKAKLREIRRALDNVDLPR